MKTKLLSLVSAMALTASAADGFTNPVLPGMHPDPSVCMSPDGNFWLVNSSFCYFPGVPLYRSRDLVNWTQHSYVLDRPSQLPLDRAGVWDGIYAPTIRYDNGRFYMITTNVTGGGNFLVHTTDPDKGWSDPIWLEQGGIDPSLYFEDGHCYMVSNPDGMVWLCEIDPLTGKKLSESVPLWSGTGGRYPESPHIYKKDGWYYLLLAEGGTELAHKVTIARARDIRGPYTSNPANPILTHCSQEGQSNIIQGTGHADFVEAPDGSWWMVFLGFRHQNGSHHLLGRETFLAPIRWDKGSWPVVNAGQTVQTDMQCPTLPLHSWPQEPRRDEFDTDTLSLRYMWMRHPEKERYTLKDGTLRLKASDRQVGAAEGSPTVLFKRQDAIDMLSETHVSIPAKATAGFESGLTVFATPSSHYDLYLNRLPDGKTEAVARYCLSEINHIEKRITLPAGQTDATLRITATPEQYIFAVSTDGKNFEEMGRANTRYLSTETAGGFTGTMIGIYATSPDGEGDAVFDYFE